MSRFHVQQLLFDIHDLQQQKKYHDYVQQQAKHKEKARVSHNTFQQPPQYVISNKLSKNVFAVALMHDIDRLVAAARDTHARRHLLAQKNV